MHTLAHCCLQGFCCPPGSDDQVEGLAKELDAALLVPAGRGGVSIGMQVAKWIDDNDMALVPKSIAVAIHGAHVEASKLKPDKDHKKD